MIVTEEEYENRRIRRQKLLDNVEHIQAFVKVMMPLLFEKFMSSSKPKLRFKCVQLVIKIITECGEDILFEAFQEISLCNFIAVLLSNFEMVSIVASLEIIQALLAKSNFYYESLLRNGIVAEIIAIANVIESDQAFVIAPFTITISEALLSKYVQSDIGTEISNSPIDKSMRKWIKWKMDSIITLNNFNDENKFLSGLKNLTKRMLDPADNQRDVLNLFVKELNGVTSYELVHSDIIQALRQSLLSGNNILAKWKTFIELFYSENESNGNKILPIKILVAKLLEALNHYDRFALQLTPSAQSRHPLAGLRLLMNPFKLNVTKKEKRRMQKKKKSEQSLEMEFQMDIDSPSMQRTERSSSFSSISSSSSSDIHSFSLQMEPLATPRAIRDFLLPKLSKANSSRPVAGITAVNDYSRRY
jgi:hypothetical protein